MNDSHSQILAIDIPSGLDCDTGKPLGIAIKANHTLTLACNKRGFLAETAKQFLGKVYVIDIGIPRLSLKEL